MTHFITHREAAAALLNEGKNLTRKDGGFLGQIYVDPVSLSDRQSKYLAGLLTREGLPPLVN